MELKERNQPEFKKVQSKLMKRLRDTLQALEKRNFNDDYDKASIRLIKIMLNQDAESPLLKTTMDCVMLTNFLDAV